ncbi:TATA box-binding protein-associated factor RNA polymerase I subunit A [Brienomyrus brachyistius]|uniref:TATA box-binding protein-associated factor RNA polymerase I subunit A n=1 Tax=Brienomyrus brachyistius TaxID=42636 RepID=UPI0020B1B8EE|nr:TATA box-binding protein-associated factor RNA polymerase I subunit A [Brienomyrus brachyistius]XP_048841940.1 TATA box-binding protein-associated factor RNA polymerase I subunit A [Brienomyrus brachyistius]
MDDISAEWMTAPARDCGSDNGDDDDDVEEQEPIRKRSKGPDLPVPAPWYGETSKETGFHRSARLCLNQIRECLFEHRWQEAAKYLISYFQTLEDTSTHRQLLAAEIIFRLGSEILHHHPNSRLEDVNRFFDLMKNTGVRGYLKVCLEQSFHLLLTGNFDDAVRQLTTAESWRYGKQSAAQGDRMKLVHAYRGFLSYLSWISKKGSTSEDDDADLSATQEMHTYFRQACISLQEILKLPGVWDPFVVGYVNMLEFYSDHEGALHVLKEYAYDNSFPPNPNAHVYLYRFLKRQGATEKKQIRVLKILGALVPSHELMLELFSLLLQSGTEQDLKEALGVIFNLLDDCSWKRSVAPWTCFRDIIKILRKKKLKRLLEGEWETRKDWWPAFHFRTYHARRDSELSWDLLMLKAFVAAALVGSGCMYCRRKIELEKEKKARRMPETRERRTCRRYPRRCGGAEVRLSYGGDPE